MTEPPPAPRPRLYRWLLVLPFAWQVALIPAVNDVRFTLWDIPFPMAWQMAGIVATTVVIAVVYRLDRRRGVDEEEVEFIARTEAAPAEHGEGGPR